jgi:hypothetical protein
MAVCGLADPHPRDPFSLPELDGTDYLATTRRSIQNLRVSVQPQLRHLPGRGAREHGAGVHGRNRRRGGLEQVEGIVARALFGETRQRKVTPLPAGRGAGTPPNLSVCRGLVTLGRAVLRCGPTSEPRVYPSPPGSKFCSSASKSGSQ